MGKFLYIAEKPSVAQEFAKALKEPMRRSSGYLESAHYVVTWCVGHLVTMSYPEAYDPALKSWRLDRLPFIPREYKYEVIDQVKDQFEIVKGQLNRPDVDVIYVCTDSGREGEYIYRLVEQMAGVSGKKRKRVWIDSQTEEEILKGIETAKDLSAYDNLASSAYMRAREDYLMGINFSRLLTLVYGREISQVTGSRYTVISVGRVMTCVLGMVVKREREIRSFVKTPFYRVIAEINCDGHKVQAEWKAVEGSRYFASSQLYKDNGFLQKEDAQAMIDSLSEPWPAQAAVCLKEKKKEKKNPPLLYNLAELQNECSKRLKISPDTTLKIVQELYEKKLVTYPRTDARVLSSAAAKEIDRNLKGLTGLSSVGAFAQQILAAGSYKGIAKTRYVNDKQITDHYAIVPTGQGLRALNSLKGHAGRVYDMIVRRFLSIFYPPAVYDKYSLVFQIKEEKFFAGLKLLAEEGYLSVTGDNWKKKNDNAADASEKASQAADRPQNRASLEGDLEDGRNMSAKEQQIFLEVLKKIRKGDVFPVEAFQLKEGETTPPKRYNSGSMILAMENAGQLIEDEELRAQIKGSGIGTSATRAEILKKLVNIHYLNLNGKTQIITPAVLGELVYEVVKDSIVHLLNPELTASWEKGLTYVAEGTITTEEYMQKLTGFIVRRTDNVRCRRNVSAIQRNFREVLQYYKKGN
ncbi:MAG: DNA topoisomerase [Lachnospiraceae bacterium]|nr:DNA topoisomerase [Lachnospiraceae bacterium]